MVFQLLLSRKSPFEFPGDRLPGFDPTHLAASGKGISVLPGLNLNLPSAATVTRLGTSQAINGIIGPGTTFTTSGYVGVTAPTAAQTFVTFGAICTGGTPGVSYWPHLIAPSITAGYLSWYFDASNVLTIFQGNIARSSGLPAVVTGVPYFCATSTQSSKVNFIIKNLLTGKVQSSTVTNPGAIPTLASPVIVGNNAGGGTGVHGNNGLIATAMLQYGVFLSVQQLQAWAEDPWSFWYPRRGITFPKASVFIPEFDAMTLLYYTLRASPRGTVTTGATTSSITTGLFTIADTAASGVVANQFVGRVILFDGNTATAGLRGAAAAIIANTASNTPTFTTSTALPATPVSGDVFSVI